MKVEVIHELLIPCVKYTDEAKLADEPPLRITSKNLQGLFGCGEKHCHHYVHIDEDKRVEFMW